MRRRTHTLKPGPARIERGARPTLDARIELPLGAEPDAWAVIAHCFTCSKDLRATRAIARGLAEHGIASLRFDFTGLGRSQGEFRDSTFTTMIEDLADAADYLARHGAPPALLVGHSLGGTCAIAAAARIGGIKAVATIGAPFEPAHTARLFGEAAERARREGEAEVELAGRPFSITDDLIEDLERHAMKEVIEGLESALLIAHAPDDRSVSIDEASRIFAAARHPKSFVSLAGADHLLTRERDARYVGGVVANWASRYLESSRDAIEEPEPMVRARTARDRFRTMVAAGRHRFIADEPASLGGTDLGPTPYDLLLAALGSCTSMTLRMYADRKEWPLEAATVRLRHERVHASDCRDCHEASDSQGKVARIERHVELRGDLSEEQRRRLLEIADRCPVHRTLESEIHVVTYADDEG